MARIRYKETDGTESDVGVNKPLPVSGVISDAALTTMDANIAILASTFDAASGSLKVNPRDNAGDTVDFSAEAPIGGGVAHDAADSGNPAKIGGIARANLSGETLVTAADRVNANFSRDGAQFVRTIAIEDAISGNASNTDGTVTTVIAAAGAGLKQYLLHASLSNSSAAGVMFDILSGAVVKWSVWVPALGGREIDWPFPGLPPNAANETWRFDPGAATTTAYCALSGYKSQI